MSRGVERSTFRDGGRDHCTYVDGALRCAKVDWPLGWFSYDRARFEEWAWHGSIVSDKADDSGLLFRRNRYYDPISGRFTQEDPIGLAGGLNLYGYAGGDPINFSDPFGLCKKKNEEAASECPPEVAKTTVRSNGGSFGSTTTVTNEYAPLSQEQVEHVINEKRAKERTGDNIAATAVGIVAWRLGLRPGPSIAAGFGVGTLGTNSTWQYMPHVGDQITTTVTTTPWASTNQQSFVVQRADGTILRLSGSPWEP
jgi:RHS repeat-associated protein